VTVGQEAFRIEANDFTVEGQDVSRINLSGGAEPCDLACAPASC
jgi:hypothetical protein